MTEVEVTDLDLLDVFVGKQNIDSEHRSNGSIRIDLYRRGCGEKTETSINLSDLEDVEVFFANSLLSRPFAYHLLVLLWFREVKLKIGALMHFEVYDFIQKSVFALCGSELDEEMVCDEFFELLDGGFLQEKNASFPLTLKGKRVAKAMFDMAEGNNMGQNREALAGKRLAAVQDAAKNPNVPLSVIEKKYDLGEKTLSRSPYKEMIAKFAANRTGKAISGKGKSYLGKNEKATKSSKYAPDHRKSHVDEVDERLDGANET